MKTIIIYLVACLLDSLLGVPDDICPMAQFYRELNCTALPENATCPDYYFCIRQPPSTCTYRGQIYTDKQRVPPAQSLHPCMKDCHCGVGNDDRFKDQTEDTTTPRFDCEVADCESTSYDSNCINIYRVKSCCNTGVVCGDEIKSLKTCEVDGTIYRVGQQFEPANTWKTCICTKSWDGDYENPRQCRDINCGLELLYQGELRQWCAPVFSTNDFLGCPIDFKCYTHNVKIVSTGNNPAPKICQFGDAEYLTGDEIQVDDECLQCTCTVPPYISCVLLDACKHLYPFVNITTGDDN